METEQIRKMADHVINIDMESAIKLPGFLGRLVPAHLKYKGFYATTIVKTNGKEVKTFYQLID